VSLRSVLTLMVVIVIVVWITSNPAHAGNVVHSLWTSVVTFFEHLAGTHS
jgi:hypothetical protein